MNKLDTTEQFQLSTIEAPLDSLKNNNNNNTR